MSNLVILFVLKLLKFYKIIISPLIGSNCRYQPTCSNYCEEAIIKHGLMKGLKLTLKRLMKCHPWGDSGFDPVPDE